MITIVESRPIKMPGLSSLKVSFSYNKTTVDTIKSANVCAVYHEKARLWEVPCCYLTRLLDALTFIDDISLTLLKEDRVQTESMYITPEPPLSEEEIGAFRFSPFDHQKEAIDYGLTVQKKWLLLDGCGVGKTLEVIGLAETLKRRGKIDHCFIICGVNSIKTVWENEIKKFSTETCRIVGKYITKTGTVRYHSIAERAEELKNPIDEFFVITNIETLRSEAVIKAISKSKNKFGMIAVDEFHKCLTGDTEILTEQGSKTIKEIFEQQIPITVLSYNVKGEVETDKIISMQKSMPQEDLLELTFSTTTGAVKTLRCTASHRLYTTNRGYIMAKDITAEDDLLFLDS